MAQAKRNRIAVIIGDAAGIGPEIVAKSFLSKELYKHNDVVVVGDYRILQREVEAQNGKLDIKIAKNNSDLLDDETCQLLHVPHPDIEKIKMGEVNLITGKASCQMMEAATQIPEISGIVYAPFNKGSLKSFDSSISSEITVFKRALSISNDCSEMNVVDNVWTSRITSHIPLKEVSSHLSIDKIVQGIHEAYLMMKKTGLKEPRIGVAGLNPHCGEGGMCGDEEIRIISPAVEKAKKSGINASGPISADVLFVKAFRGYFDLCVTMYHDQGQIALKLIGGDRGVTVLSGFPIPICTCAHGTAFDIVGKNIADMNPFNTSLKIISDLARNW
jgi:4-hydroxy-L-threonine phosphate dehydrogenase PdxA